MTPAGRGESWCWPIHPRPLPGELFSSWLLRTARANRVKLTAFAALTLGDKTLLKRDMDRGVGERDLGLLARRTVQAQAVLRATTLQSLEGALTRRMPLTSHARWVLPFGLWRSGGRVSGIPFCPACLADGEPYYRLDWRCSFAPACPVHRTLLHEGCPHCLAPALFHRLEFGWTVKNELVRTPITTCWRCQGDLCEVQEDLPAMSSGHVCCLSYLPSWVEDGPTWRTGPFSVASFGSSERERPGVTFQNDSGNGQPCRVAFVVGPHEASGKRSGQHYSAKLTCKGSWTGRCTSLTARSFELTNVRQVHVEARRVKRWADPVVGSAPRFICVLKATESQWPSSSAAGRGTNPSSCSRCWR